MLIKIKDIIYNLTMYRAIERVGEKSLRLHYPGGWEQIEFDHSDERENAWSRISMMFGV